MSLLLATCSLVKFVPPFSASYLLLPFFYPPFMLTSCVSTERERERCRGTSSVQPTAHSTTSRSPSSIQLINGSFLPSLNRYVLIVSLHRCFSVVGAYEEEQYSGSARFVFPLLSSPSPSPNFQRFGIAYHQT